MLINFSSRLESPFLLLYRILLFCFPIFFIACTQADDFSDVPDSVIQSMPPTEADVFYESTAIQYPLGSDAALREFVTKNTRYPEALEDSCIDGKVYVNFFVSETGEIENIRVARSLHPLLDQEALRVVSLIPKSEPSTMKGVPIGMSWTIPVSFSLK